MDVVRVGIIGTGFIGEAHVEALKLVPDARVIAVASPTPGKAKAFAAKYQIEHSFEDYRDLLAVKEIDMVTLGIPNDLHAEVTIMAARMRKHVVCEKPLCLTLEEADDMITACQRAGVLLLYAEDLVFAPKYVRAKMLADEGAFGRVFAVKQSEEHFGPHSPWFWDVNRSGGGTLMDMGCHSVEYARWVLGKPNVKSVFASLGTYVHGGKTTGEDHSFCVIEFENGAVSMAENSWAKRGGVDDRGEIYGDQGFTRIDLSRGSALLTYSEAGYGYAVEKASMTAGYTFTMYDELWNSGYPQEMQHFVRCVRGLETPIETGEDGREVLKILYAAYQSAGEGRRIDWPYNPPKVSKPIDLWKR
jgi:myo-inositol 2-dehydrogenase / D-chiro-inositol 1-dehydrogenase